MYCIKPRLLRWQAALSLLLGCVITLLLSACGGVQDNGSQSLVISANPISGTNVLPVHVNAGLGQLANRLYASVTVCAPQSSTRCVTIDNILVDTGSTGLRLISTSALSALGLQSPPGYSSLQNCVQFLDHSSAWGSIRNADVHLGSQVAPSIPIQLINDPASSAFTSRYCTGTAITEAIAQNSSDTHALDANGILGLGISTEDCGSPCASNALNGSYYSCTSTACSPTTVPTSAQTQNPIPHFAFDNNGLVVVLPPVPASGATAVDGNLIFGIGTQENNKLDNSLVMPVSASNFFYLHTSIQSASPASGASINSSMVDMPESFPDTGSNGLYFGLSALPLCSAPIPSAFYCPPSAAPVTFSTSVRGDTANSKAVAFTVSNAADMFSNSSPGYYALPTLGGINSDTSFDWGLPFYFGRSVFMGIAGKPARTVTGTGSAIITGPFYAF